MHFGIPFRRLLFVGLLLGGFGQGMAVETDDFRPILKAQLARYPEMQVQDCYKLLYQACLGSEHAVNDPAVAARWLEKELAELGPGPDEPVIDPIASDGRIVRVHLRAFVQHKGDTARLAQAFVQTANTYHGSREVLAAAWKQVISLAATGELPFPVAAVQKYGLEMAAAGYPAVHHSEKFQQRYGPAYRVIAREFVAGLRI